MVGRTLVVYRKTERQARPDSSIEPPSSGKLRLPAVSARVERWAPGSRR